MKSLFAILASAGIVLSMASLGKAEEGLKVGDNAPAFELPGTDGKTYKLSNFKGKKAVIVAWYPKALTGG